MDLPAKADAQYFVHHNGEFGCPFCLNPGKSVSTKLAKKKEFSSRVFGKEGFPRKNSGEYHWICQKGCKEHCTGLNSFLHFPPIFFFSFFLFPFFFPKVIFFFLSFLFLPGTRSQVSFHFFLLFPLFSILWGFSVDYMHCVPLCVVKKLANLFFDSKYSGHRGQDQWNWCRCSQYQTSERDQTTSEILEREAALERFHTFFIFLFFSFFPFSTFECTLSSNSLQFLISSAIEYRTWLLYDAPIVLHRYLLPVYYEHFCLLANDLRILLSNSITET